ncbi:hypothetical protein [Nitratiruptor sp. SB155-2]|uniref:hypothetical protein n=1 Tax=Nitratiruptor sp. (strain SB155-2) TaxID=387092 RepID=UPI000158716B|nr:hypothetical protein [Nitratiruptor sp. SB155-2]BAF70917.1 conserved hypothetical protein [Nitratiruptor sp. SB155-2]
MFNISKEFAPPFKLIAPFFISGVLFYLIATGALLFYPASFDFLDLSIAGWVHLFLLGYVMMVIFGAMAQLVPVVLETGHFSVDWFYVIFPLLLFGTILLVLGFWFDPILISFGGILVLASMIIFAIDVFLTIRKTELKSITVQAVKISNIFLLIGILSGFLMALTLSGFWSVNIEDVIKAHVFAVLGGYVMITIYGISLVLLPMFGLAHGFYERPVHIALRLMVGSVVLVLIGAFLGWSIFRVMGYILAFLSTGAYLYQIFLIYKARIRKERDIWSKSMFAGYGFFIYGIVLGFIYLLSGGSLPNILHTSAWSLFVFFAFLINGHLYKIIPFLVWFHRFSALVGKQKVPMLHEMIPKKQAEYQFWFSLAGSVLVALGLIFENDILLKSGASFLFAGALFLVVSTRWMLQYRSENG